MPSKARRWRWKALGPGRSASSRHLSPSKPRPKSTRRKKKRNSKRRSAKPRNWKSRVKRKVKAIAKVASGGGGGAEGEIADEAAVNRPKAQRWLMKFHRRLKRCRWN